MEVFKAEEERNRQSALGRGEAILDDAAQGSGGRRLISCHLKMVWLREISISLSVKEEN